MRTPSRNMPRPELAPMPWGCSLFLAALAAALIALVVFYPIALAGIAVLVLVIVAMKLEGDSRLRELAAGRRGESICTFARSFDYRAVDTWIIRAVFEGLQPYCTFGKQVMPLRRTDGLFDTLGIDGDELEDLVELIAYCTRRSLEGSTENPFYGNVTTVSDLVMFFMNQPRTA
jgi:hypothetical protein